VLEDVEVEWAQGVAVVLLVPFSSANSKLESVHTRAVVLQLLISVLYHVETVHLVLVANV
jgi:hypothetical protein